MKVDSDTPMPQVYEIKVKGHLSPDWADWFDCMTLKTDTGSAETTLRGPFVDQAALYGLLVKGSRFRIDPAERQSSSTRSFADLITSKYRQEELMKAIVREHFETEIREAQRAAKAGDFEAAWTALQRAHILGQAYPLPHAIAHWEMLRLAWRQRDTKEMAGQFIPTALAVPLTFLFGRKRSLRAGKVNVNNPDKSIPEDLLQILNQ